MYASKSNLSLNLITKETEFQSIFNIWQTKNNLFLESNIEIHKLFDLEKQVHTQYNKFKNKNIENDKLFDLEKQVHTQYKKKIIYTAIIGHYDTLKEPKYITDNWEYICFTDNPNKIKSNVWKIVDIKNYEQLTLIDNKILLARIIKWSPLFLFEHIDFSIWVDANMVINTDLNVFLESIQINYPIILTKHPNRNCIYQEIIAIKSRIERGIIKENIGNVNKWALELQYNLKYPSGLGLCQTGLKIHNHKFKQELEDLGQSMRTFMNKFGIIRDQLIFNYISYTNHLKINTLNPLPSIGNKDKVKYKFYLLEHNKI